MKGDNFRDGHTFVATRTDKFGSDPHVPRTFIGMLAFCMNGRLVAMPLHKVWQAQPFSVKNGARMRNCLFFVLSPMATVLMWQRLQAETKMQVALRVTK